MVGCAQTAPVVAIDSNGHTYRGSATAAMDGGSFQVGYKETTCGGDYNSWSTESVITMQVTCSDGRKGPLSDALTTDRAPT